MIALHDLNLKGALNLLGHDAAKPLPDQAESATGFLQQVIDQLCELSLKDPLTGLANRRHFREVLSREIDVVARSGEPALLLMLDIDHFKKINDTHGHPAGDQVLQAIAQCLETCVRPMDTVARYGGEEFAVILPSCQVAYGRIVADRIRESIETLSVQLSSQLELQVTVSIGGAFAPEWIRSTTALWTDRADSQLYRAKAEGRNRVCIDEQEDISVSAEEKSLLFGHLALDDAAWIDSVANDTPGDASRAAQS
jgi:two-component system, cell cycle response regulator